jgi:hypothetical protein
LGKVALRPRCSLQVSVCPFGDQRTYYTGAQAPSARQPHGCIELRLRLAP